MPKVPINPLAAGFRSSNRLNDNFEQIQDAFDNTLSRDGTGPNQMLASLDMNSQRILNLPAPVDPTDPLRLAEYQDFSDELGTKVDVDAFPGSPGILVQTGMDTSNFEARALVSGIAGVTVTNGSGVSGSPSIGLSFANESDLISYDASKPVNSAIIKPLVDGKADSDLENVSDSDFGEKSIAISGSYAPRPAIIGRATATFDVEDYYGSGDTARTNHNTALTNAVAALNANGSGRLLCRRPLSSLTSNQTITANFAELVFSRSDLLTKTSTTGNLFTLTGQHVEIADLFVEAPTSSTSGYIVQGTSTSGQFDVHGMRSVGGYSILQPPPGGEVTILDCRGYNPVADAIRFPDAFTGQGRVTACRYGAPGDNTNIGAGIYITGGDTVDILQTDVTSFKFGLVAAPVAGTFLRNLNLTSVFADGVGRTDGASSVRILIDGSAAGAEISRIAAVNTWSSAGSGVGMIVKGNVKSAYFTQHRSLANGRYGLLVEAGSTNPEDLHFENCTFSGNSQESSNTYDDVRIENGVSDFYLEGGQTGFSNDLSVLGLTNKTAYAVNVIGTTHNRVKINPDRIVNGVSGGISFPVANRNFQGAGDLGWTEGEWTPIVTSEGGTITTVGTCTGHYQRIGRLVVGSATIAITTAGTATGELRFTLPFTAGNAINNCGVGREQNVNGKEVFISVPGNSTTGKLKNYDNSDPWVNNGLWYCSFSYWTS